MEQNRDIYSAAEEKVESRILFYKHLAVFVAINLFLCIINLICSARISWALWPILGMGLLVVTHAYYVIFHTQGLKERMIEKEVGKDKNKEKEQ